MKLELQQFGGRGQSNPNGGGWKSKLNAYARRGEMPTYITGNRDQQAQVFEEIDKLYSMPETDARIVDQGDGVWVQLNGKVYQAGYPSKENASEAEKRGVLKKVLYNAGEKGTAAQATGWRADYNRAIAEEKRFSDQARAMDAEVKAAKSAYYAAPTRSKAQKEEAARLKQAMDSLTTQQQMLQYRAAQFGTFADNLLYEKAPGEYRRKKKVNGQRR